MVNQIEILKWSGVVVSVASVVHTLLPPWDWNPDFVAVGLKDFPTAQKAFYGVFHNRWYKLGVYVVGYIALNGRSTVWRMIAIKNGTNGSITKLGQPDVSITNSGQTG